ncbi:MAG: G/U mismatch-specific DNA glycosylase [Candidatus Eisenbacteria bacterium]|nr:G/U mismatch-specific DNA glycosylase [Candidatus Eisenbacteria bacterium]
MTSRPWKPTREQLLEATGKSVPDVIGHGLKLLFVGINPGLYTAAVGHHFARPGNRFWPALHHSGFTERQLSPFEERELLAGGIGIANLVGRATVAAGELTREEQIAGARRLVRKVRRYRPRFIAVLGLDAYRNSFERPGAAIGEQPERLGETRIWVLPNPSGLNAHYSPADFARLFRELRLAVERSAEEPRGAREE